MGALLNPFVFASTGPAIASYIGGKVGPASAASTYSITAVPLGSGGLVVIAVHYIGYADSAVIGSATIAGVSATILQQTAAPYSSSAFKNGVALIAARVPAGVTSGTVVLNFAASMGTAYVGVYRVGGLRGDVPTAKTGAVVQTGTAASISLNVNADGILIGAAAVYSRRAVSLTAGVAGDYNAISYGTDYRAVGGNYGAVADEVGRTITLTRGTGDGLQMVGGLIAVAFR
jgi:hypothetical protein